MGNIRYITADYAIGQEAPGASLIPPVVAE